MAAPIGCTAARRREAGAVSLAEAVRSGQTRALPGATVLQIVPALVNEPSARNAVNIASALLRAGARALIASEGGRYVGELQALGGEWMQVAATSHNPFTLRRNARRFYDLVAGEKVDLVHAYSGPTAWSARAGIRTTHARLVTTYAGAPVSGFGTEQRFQRALARGDRVLVDSAYAAELVHKRHLVPLDWIVPVANSIDVERFDRAAVGAERLDALREEWRIPERARVILVPGRIAPDKGQMTVVDAARILVNGGLRGAIIVIAGDDGEDPDYCHDLVDRVRAQGLAGLIRRVRHCGDMPAAYAMADMVLVPSVEPATFSRIVAEAHASATPVIASAVGALPEMVLAPPFVSEADRLGWLVPPSDPMELARAIAELLALGHAQRRALRVRAHAFAENFYTPARVAAATLNVYTGLLESAR
jgi:glycosyltransferase involved in cell wall biosynthesis